MDHHEHDRPKPPERVLRAFGADGFPASLAGGRGLAWRAGSLVVKPADTTEESLAWQAETLGRVNGDQLRVAMPRRSARGTFVFDGWMASSFCAGTHERRRWLDIAAVADRLHAALSGVGRPAFVLGRDDPWANADRVAWGEISMAPYLKVPHVARLAALLAPVDDPPQVIHGDLTGNVLFADPLPPAVIDLAVYWRPAPYARAIVVADALAWEGATPVNGPMTSRRRPRARGSDSSWPVRSCSASSRTGSRTLAQPTALPTPRGSTLRSA